MMEILTVLKHRGLKSSRAQEACNSSCTPRRPIRVAFYSMFRVFYLSVEWVYASQKVCYLSGCQIYLLVKGEGEVSERCLNREVNIEMKK